MKPNVTKGDTPAEKEIITAVFWLMGIGIAFVAIVTYVVYKLVLK